MTAVPLSELRRELNQCLEALYPLALKLTRDRDQARDLIQQTALRALRSEDQYTSGTNLGAWLHTILRNEFRDRGRRSYKRQTENIDDIPPYRLSVRPDQESPLVLRDISKAIKLTPLQQRGVLALVGLGFTYDEIAEVMHVSIGTVKSRLWRGRQTVQKALS